jgi:NADH-quinone oxidoreductase subunit C
MVEGLKSKFGDNILEVKIPRKDRIYVRVARDALVDIARFIKDELGFDMPISSGGTDYPKKNVIEIFWAIWSSSSNVVLMLKTDVDRESPVVDSLTVVWRGVQKFERETWELLGVDFRGHPRLKPLLLPEDWEEGYPLRKDFSLDPYRSKWGDMEDG